MDAEMYTDKMRKRAREGETEKEVSVEGRRGEGRGLKKYHFSFTDLKGVIYLIITIPSIFQRFDIRSMTAPWP